MVDDILEGEWEELSDGRKVVRGEDGTFKHVALSSEKASEIGTSNRVQRISKTQETRANRLLSELGYADPDEAPEVTRILAETIARGGATATPAIATLVRVTTKDATMVGLKKPESWQRCLLCGRLEPVVITPEAADRLSIALKVVLDGMR